MQDNRRISARHQTLGMMSNIFDGNSAVLGIVEDISRDGICISKIPIPFAVNLQNCLAIINSPRRDFHMALHACWKRSTDRGMYRMIGFQVPEPPESWLRFVDSIENDAGVQDPYNILMVSTADEN